MGILYDFKDSLKTEKLVIPWTADISDTKAGTPFAADGTVSNDGDAKGLLAEDIRTYWNKRVKSDTGYTATVDIITGGYIDKDAAEESCGMTYADALVSALTDIVFVEDGKLPSGGDEEPELPEVTTDDNGKVLKVTDGAWKKGDETKELPSVTSADNGKMLGVENGAWKKVNAPSGGGGAHYIHAQIEFSPETSRFSVDCDTTFDELVGFIDDGEIIIAEADGLFFHLASHEASSKIVFMNNSGSTADWGKLTCKFNDVWTYEEGDYS